MAERFAALKAKADIYIINRENVLKMDTQALKHILMTVWTVAYTQRFTHIGHNREDYSFMNF